MVIVGMVISWKDIVHAFGEDQEVKYFHQMDLSSTLSSVSFNFAITDYYSQRIANNIMA